MLSLIYNAGMSVKRVMGNALANQRDTEHHGNQQSQIVHMESVMDPKATNPKDTNNANICDIIM